MNLIKLYHLADKYFKLCVAVPLDSWTDTRGEKERNEFPLPELENYVAHFDRTAINYRIIYLPHLLEREIGASRSEGLDYITELSISQANQNIDKKIKQLKENCNLFLVNGKILPEKREEYFNLRIKINALTQLKQSFSSDSINIIANRLTERDDKGPECVSHDLGHRENIIKIIENNLESLLPAFFKDYQASIGGRLNDNLNQDLEDIKSLCAWGENKFLFLEAVASLIAANFSMAESISKKNLTKKEILDILPDFLAEYHFQGDSLARLKKKKLIGQDMYFKMSKGGYLEELSTEPIYIREADNRSVSGVLKCVNKDLPALNNKFQKEFDLQSISDQIKQELTSYIGKVICLW